MPLRSPDIVGMIDPRDITGPVRARTAPDLPVESQAQGTGELEPSARVVAEPAGAGRDTRTSVSTKRLTSAMPSRETPREDLATATATAESERVFIQILVQPELAVRVARASHYLKTEVHKARFQQTIMGALIEHSIPAPTDPSVIATTAGLIARWRQEPLSESRASRRLGWYLPVPIGMRLDRLLLSLKEQHYRLRPSATSLLAALIWLELDPDTTKGREALRALVVPYHDKWERPDYTTVAA